MPTPEIEAYIKNLKTSDENKAALWDSFYETQDLKQFEAKLKTFPLPDDVRGDLWDFKQQTTPIAFTPVEEPGMGVKMPPQTTPGLLESVVNPIIGAAKGFGQIATASNLPAQIELAKGMYSGIVDPIINQYSRAKESYQQGNMPSAAMNAGLMVPGVGPQLAQWGRQAQAGNYAQPAGELIGNLLMSVGPAAAAKLKVNPTALLNPVEREAVKFMVEKNIHFDIATGTQSPFFSGLQAYAEKIPFIGGTIKRSQAKTQAGLQRVGAELADQVYGASSIVQSNLRAGMSLKNAAEEKLLKTTGKQQDRYTALDALAQQNVKPVQTAFEPRTGPIIENVAAPVDMRFIKVEAKKILERFDKNIPLVQRDASPGYQIVKQIAERPDYVDLQTAIFDGNAVGRRAASDVLGVKDASQAVSSKIYGPLQGEIDKTVAGMGPDAIRFLEEGRQFTKQKYDLKEWVETLGAEPGQIASNLIKGGERSFETLKALKREFPNEIPNLAKAQIEELMNSHTSLGRLRGASTLAAWKKIGIETKQVLFNDPKLVKDLDNLFNSAAMAAFDANPSGSGKVLALGSGIGGIGWIILHPTTGIPFAVGTKLLAEVMYNQGGAMLVRRALTQGPSTLAGKDTAMRLWVAANVAQQSNPGLQPLVPILPEGQPQQK